MRATTIEGLNAFARTLCFAFYVTDGWSCPTVYYIFHLPLPHLVGVHTTSHFCSMQVILTAELPMGQPGNVAMSSLVLFLRQTDSQLLYDLLFQPFQGHPTTVFCKLCLRRSKYCLEFSFA